MNEEVVKSNQLLEEEDEYGNLARDIGKYFFLTNFNGTKRVDIKRVLWAWKLQQPEKNKALKRTFS